MKIVHKALNSSRNFKQFLKFFYFLTIGNLSLYFAFLLRYEGFFISFENHSEVFILNNLSILIFLFSSKIYRNIFRFEHKNIFFKVSIFFISNSVFLFMSIMIFNIDGVSRSAVIIYSFCGIFFYYYSRVVITNLIDRFSEQKETSYNIIVYGAGSLGQKIFKLLKVEKPTANIFFVDDNPSFQKDLLDGNKIFDSSDISYLIKKFQIKEFVFGIQNIDFDKKSKIITQISKYNLPIKSLPTIFNEEKLNLNNLKEIDDSRFFSNKLVISEHTKNFLENKIVLVTGAGGSIGSEICNQLISCKVKKLYAIDFSEISLFDLKESLSRMSHNIPIDFHLVNLCDHDSVKELSKRDNYQIIFHAAAYKHVDLVENNIKNSVKNNILSFKNLIESFTSKELEKFILVSTDKAVKPKSIMGFTKRICEIILYFYSKEVVGKTYSVVRFGNVIGSSGSVIPKFLKQLNNNEPLTVSSKEAQRFFMTIPDAVSLVLESSFISKNGDVHVLDMGEPVNIFDLAKKMIQYQGIFMSDEDYISSNKIQITGLKKGEKLQEEIFLNSNYKKTSKSEILYSEEFQKLDQSDFDKFLNQLILKLNDEGKQDFENFIYSNIEKF